MKKKLLDRRGAAIELAIMMMVFSIFITTIILTTALLQNEHKTKAQLGIEQDIFLEQLGEEFVNAVLNGEGNTGWLPDGYEGIDITLGDAKKHNWSDYVITKVTCVEDGKRTRTCLSCGAQETEILVKAKGHHIEGATCKQNSGECDRCGELVTLSIEHSINWENQAQCGQGLVAKGICTVCEETIERNLSGLEHEWSKKVLLEATCDDPGIEEHTCVHCGEVKKVDVPALGHVWDEGIVTTEATAEIHGIKKYTCLLCQVPNEEYVHCWNEGELTENTPCREQSKITRKCTCTDDGEECSELLVEMLPLEPHNFDESNICSVCGAGRYNYVLTVMTAGKNAYKLYIQETNSDLSTIDIPEETEPEISAPGETLPETTEPEETEPDVVEICGTVVLKIALEWEATSNVYKITEWSKK